MSRKEKVVLTGIAICTVAMLGGVLGVLFMPNIKEWFHKPSRASNPTYRMFTENDTNISVNWNDEFEVRFRLNGEKEGEGWSLQSGFDRNRLSIMEGGYGSTFQSWKFYAKAGGTTTLYFQKGDQTKDFMIKVN
jgi:hypothetical protein